MNLFKRNSKRTKEITPQLTSFERRTLQVPGVPPNKLSYSVYDAMEFDSMIQTVMTIKKLAVLAPEWKIIGEDQERIAFLERNFHQMTGSVNTLLFAAMDAFAKGWSIQELVFEERDRRIWLHSVRPKDPSLFGVEFDAYGKPVGLQLQLPGETPIQLPRDKFVLFFNRPSYSRPKGRSDLDAVYPHWTAKRSLLAAWSLHLERFAMPTVLGKYVRGLPQSEQAAILDALTRLQNNLAILHPSEIEVSTLGGDREASTGFQEAVEFHNREIARAVLGQTLTTDEGRRVGSLALGKVHLQVLLLQSAATRKLLADELMTEQVIRPLIELNYGGGEIPRFEFASTELEAFSIGRLL